MTFFALALLPILPLAQAGQAVKLNRVYVKGEKHQYEVKSTMNVEGRMRGLETWIPEDLDIQYKFSTEVVELKADGIADVRYKRPTLTEIQGETVDAPPKATTEKLNWDMLLTLSPTNEILKTKDLAKKEPEKKPAKPPAKGLHWIGWSGSGEQHPLSAILGQFVGEVYRLSLFLGPLDGSMDLAPKLPYDEVAPGETWKRTVGYTPQKLKGTDGKMAVQRLDYLYTYEGVVQSQGKQVHRVTAKLDVKTDLAEFVHQTFNVKPDATGLKEIPLEFSGKIEFDLDLKTKKTLRAVGTSTGGFRVLITQFPNQPVEEQRLKGRTILKLLNP
jgi:hypothetical protein